MTSTARKRGRPPKISRGDIANAALEIGLDQATIRNVAEKLGVSVMGVYHHVGNADELRDLAIARELDKLLGPVGKYATFEDALWDCARRFHDLLTSYPEMILRMLGGRIKPDGTALYFESLLSCGARHGLSEAETFHAARCVLLSAAGAAVTNASAVQSGSAPFLGVLEEGTAMLEERQTPHVRALLETRVQGGEDPLECVRMTIKGLRETIGERMIAGPRLASAEAG